MLPSFAGSFPVEVFKRDLAGSIPAVSGKTLGLGEEFSLRETPAPLDVETLVRPKNGGYPSGGTYEIR